MLLFRSSLARLHRAANPLLLVQCLGMGVVGAFDPLSAAGGAAAVGAGLLTLIRRYERRTVLALTLLGNGRQVEIETASMLGFVRRRRVPVGSFFSTNAPFPPKSFWLAASVARPDGPGREVLLFEASGHVPNVKRLNAVLSGEHV